MTSTEQKQPDSDWQDCPTGEVGQLVSRLRTRRRRQILTQAAIGVTGLCLLVVAGIFAVPSVTELEPSYGGITCSEVRRQAVAYVSGTVDSLIAEKIKNHLDECGPCRRLIEQMPATATAFSPDNSPQMIAERNQPPVDSHLVAFSPRQ